jgi:hypothetical protein
MSISNMIFFESLQHARADNNREMNRLYDSLDRFGSRKISDQKDIVKCVYNAIKNRDIPALDRLFDRFPYNSELLDLVEQTAISFDANVYPHMSSICSLYETLCSKDLKYEELFTRVKLDKGREKLFHGFDRSHCGKCLHFVDTHIASLYERLRSGEGDTLSDMQSLLLVDFEHYANARLKMITKLLNAKRMEIFLVPFVNDAISERLDHFAISELNDMKSSWLFDDRLLKVVFSYV